MDITKIRTGETYLKVADGRDKFRRVVEIFDGFDGRVYVKYVDCGTDEESSILLESFARWASSWVLLDPYDDSGSLDTGSNHDPGDGVLLSELLGGDGGLAGVIAVPNESYVVEEV